MRPPALRGHCDAVIAPDSWRRLLVGRRGWFAVSLPSGRVVPLFVWVQDYITYLLDMPWRPTGEQGVYFYMPLRGLPSALVPLGACDWEEVSGVFELVVTFDLNSSPQTCKVVHTWRLTAPLPGARRHGRSGSRSARSGDVEDDASDGSSSVSCKERSDDSGPDPVLATDLDSGVDVPPDPNEISKISSESEAYGESGDEVAEEEDEEGDDGALGAKRRRHPPGTFKVWESTWFYMTQHPEHQDIKVWVKRCLREGEFGMARPNFSRTLTPAKYGPHETPQDCPRTKFLLRCWCVWRARRDGWAAATEDRRDDVAAQVDALRAAYADLRPLAPGPILGDPAAEKLALAWAPDVFDGEPRSHRRRGRRGRR